jgi:hypothetical protein
MLDGSAVNGGAVAKKRVLISTPIETLLENANKADEINENSTSALLEQKLNERGVKFAKL